MSEKIPILDDTTRSGAKHMNPDPDCLRCMRKKLRAVSIVVFFKDGTGWRLDRFEGDKPSEAAEAEFQFMLRAGVPEAVANKGRPVLLESETEIADIFPKLKDFFQGQTVIAAPVQFGKSVGVRVAWREQSDPFSTTDAELIECQGLCPDGCGPTCAH